MLQDVESCSEDGGLVIPLESRLADRERLARVFLSQWNYQEVRRIRRILVHLLAAFGVVLWMVARWPGIITAGVESTVSALWLPCLAGTAAIAILEIVFYRRRQQCLSEFESPDF